MSETPSSIMPPPARDADGTDVAELMTRALRGLVAPRRSIVVTSGRASPDEGLALVAAFLEIEDPTLRQALLDAAALLAVTRS